MSLVIPVEGDRDLFLVGLGRSLAVVRWAVSDPDRHAVKAEAVLHTVDPQSPTNRFNDGKCDPQGRLWAGTDEEDEKEIVRLVLVARIRLAKDGHNVVRPLLPRGA